MHFIGARVKEHVVERCGLAESVDGRVLNHEQDVARIWVNFGGLGLDKSLCKRKTNRSYKIRCKYE